MEIDTELNEKRTKLQVYEKVEQELDEVVMQAAQGLSSSPSSPFWSTLSLQWRTTVTPIGSCSPMVTELRFQLQRNGVFNTPFISPNA